MSDLVSANATDKKNDEKTDRSCDLSQPLAKLHDNEKNKQASRYLRGTIKPSLFDELTGSMPHDDVLLLKFHGIYQQDDREKRSDRKARKLEPDYQFMVRLRIPGGRCTRNQWLGLDNIARTYAERGLRITTRQTIQLHGIRKHKLQACMQAISAIGLDTIAACGDDSRGVICGVNPHLPAIQQQVEQLAVKTSQHLIPKTRAYPEIWLDKPPADANNTSANTNEDPLYGPLYLPRKFKVGFAIPPFNDIDVYGQDLGFIAIVEDNQLVGFNVCVGGGMGQLDNREDSYPRTATEIGFITPENIPEFAATVMGIQRDYGDRVDRHRARFKYTLDTHGIDWFVETLAQRTGKALQPLRAFSFVQNSDVFGWQQGDDSLWQITLYVESGRIIGPLQSQLQALLQNFSGSIRLTTNQNISLTHIHEAEKQHLEWHLADLGLLDRLNPDIQEANTLSCVALPTCGLAMAESERYLPHFLQKFSALKAKHQLLDTPITLRITGCPNGCARPYLAEIGLTGRAPGLYNLYLGGGAYGQRLNQLFATNADEPTIFSILDELLLEYSSNRQLAESFGDFLVRTEKINQQLLSIKAV